MEQAGSVSWSDGIKGDTNQALVLLRLVLHILQFSLIVFALSLGCSYIAFARLFTKTIFLHQ